MGYKRNCPTCGKEIIHSFKHNCIRAIEKGVVCRSCAGAKHSEKMMGENNPMFGRKHTEDTIRKFKQREHSHVKEKWFKELRSKQCKGKGSPCYGTSLYEIWLNKYGTNKADELEGIRKSKLSKIFSGENNPMFGKPPPLKAVGRGWSGWYGEWFFRSLKELSYVIKSLKANNLKWVSAECLSLKIKYVNSRGEKRNYFADFLVEDELLVEVKPKGLHQNKEVILKRDAAIDFCNEKKIKYAMIDPPLLSWLEIFELIDKGEIVFSPKYQEKLKALRHE